MKISGLIVLIGITASMLILTTGGCMPRTDSTLEGRKSMMIQKDYEALTGRWQLVQSIVDGKPVPETELRNTVLITDHDTFRFPADAGVGTAPQGRFTIDPTKNPKEVDSTALAGPNKGEITRGIYEIMDPNNKRACWGRPGGPRPTDFTSAPGSGRTMQYWRLISKELGS
jgi:uncharacterized protein (TIGR03067 family)